MGLIHIASVTYEVTQLLVPSVKIIPFVGNSNIKTTESICSKTYVTALATRLFDVPPFLPLVAARLTVEIIENLIIYE